MKRTALGIAAALTIAVSGAVPGVVASPAGTTAQRQVVDSSYALVQLSAAPLATSAKTRPVGGKKINLRSAAVKSHRALLSAQRNAFKTWLRTYAPKARVSAEFDLALNAVGVKLNGTTLDQAALGSGVAPRRGAGRLPPVAHDDPDLDLVNANEAGPRPAAPRTPARGSRWRSSTAASTSTHPCFDDAGYAPQPQEGPAAPDQQQGDRGQGLRQQGRQERLRRDATRTSHGTHVAGTVACNAHTPAVVDGVDIPYDPSGVAPRALLGNYNVFPGDRAARGPRTSSRPWRTPTRTGSTSST